MHEAPRQSGANGNRSERIRCRSGLELRHEPLRAVLNRVLGLVHHLVLGLAHVGPNVILEPADVLRGMQPGQVVGKPCPRLLDIALERIEFGRAHRLPCLGPVSGRVMLGLRPLVLQSCPASKLWPRLPAGLCGAVVPRP